ncbi:acyltransferase [Paenibacillus sp. PR3]|uniref:Acyltransferase n=1 Tax=Paenibacillus terricola TaxID=2763503 RepID=A0ABR8N057_9BACL|nr:acyltransferase [Paenibacillus terricola]MBD3919834.1 acyltransferase [Paenibacillus terricola]
MKSVYNLNNLDIMKFIAAILIVSIHTTPLLSLNETLSLAFENTIARIAVPFFFAASGYLFFSKISNTNYRTAKLADSYWVKYTKRIALIYLVWSVIYGVYDIQHSYQKHDHDLLRGILFYLRDFVLLGGHFHLWYFPALLFAITALYFGIRMMSLSKLLLVSIVLYVIGLFGDAYFGLLGDDTVLSRFMLHYFELFGTTRNGLFFGLVYVVLGACIYERGQKVRHSKPGLLFSISLVGLILEVVLLNQFTVIRDCNMLIMLLPTTYFLFQMLLHKQSPNWSIDFKLLRDSSLLVYCSHGMFLGLYSNVLGHVEAHSFAWFTLVFLSSLAMSLLIVRLRGSEITRRYVSILY